MLAHYSSSVRSNALLDDNLILHCKVPPDRPSPIRKSASLTSCERRCLSMDAAVPKVPHHMKLADQLRRCCRMLRKILIDELGDVFTRTSTASAANVANHGLEPAPPVLNQRVRRVLGQDSCHFVKRVKLHRGYPCRLTVLVQARAGFM